MNDITAFARSNERRFPIITICGSMRFTARITQAAGHLSRLGFIVLAPFVVFRKEDQLEPDKRMLDEMHMVKVDMAQAVCLVTDSSFYFGKSTTSELEYAEDTSKPIFVTAFDGQFAEVDLEFLRIAKEIADGQ